MTKEQYGVVAGRRQTYDQLLWQTPVLSLTAQAFLLTIALGHDSSITARLMSALLSLITALASIQLMAKHRYFEVLATRALLKFEEENKINGFDSIHAQRPSPAERVSFLENRSAYAVWTVTLSAFAVVALIVILLVLCKPSLFS